MDLEWNHKIFGVKEEDFEAMALEVFQFQYENNPVYKSYVQALKLDPRQVKSIEQIPYLPIRFFKTHEVKTTSFEPQAVFESSGTSGSSNSLHWVKDILWYEESFTKGFEFFYGPIIDYCIIGLLPSYLERKNSSLVHMTQRLIRLSGYSQSGFYLDEYEKLFAVLNELSARTPSEEKQQQKTLLIGVTFALLDFAERFPLSLKCTTVMETGGMKGRRKEMIREEVHAILKKSFSLDHIHSEYGMTELLSQAYSKGEGIFYCPPWMKVMIRDEEDPLNVQSLAPITTRHSPLPTLTGAINIIDLANIYSCSFIATDDIGKLYEDGSFEVLGRMDGSDLRGCSLMLV